jgi:hypothetical protein
MGVQSTQAPGVCTHKPIWSRVLPAASHIAQSPTYPSRPVCIWESCRGRRLLRSKSVANEHSEPGGMKVLRLYADALGESRFETTTMPMVLKEFAPLRLHYVLATPNPLSITSS